MGCSPTPHRDPCAPLHKDNYNWRPASATDPIAHISAENGTTMPIGNIFLDVVTGGFKFPDDPGYRWPDYPQRETYAALLVGCKRLGPMGTTATRSVQPATYILWYEVNHIEGSITELGILVSTSEGDNVLLVPSEPQGVYAHDVDVDYYGN